MDALNGKDPYEELRNKYRAERDPKFPVNLVTEWINEPLLWTLHDPLYSWLTKENIAKLESFPFSYRDILECASHFLTLGQACDLLMVTESDLDLYVQILWRKPIRMVYQALLTACKKGYVDKVFAPWAEKGSSMAMSVMSRIMKLDEEDHSNEIRVRFVNDLTDDQQQEDPNDPE